MKGERRVRLIAASREVRVSAEPGSDVLRYPGISVVRVDDGRPTEETWVPLGASPSFADDEAVIAALRAAVQWHQAGASVPRLHTAAPEELVTDLHNSRYRPGKPDHSTTYTPTNCSQNTT